MRLRLRLRFRRMRLGEASSNGVVDADSRGVLYVRLGPGDKGGIVHDAIKLLRCPVVIYLDLVLALVVVGIAPAWIPPTADVDGQGAQRRSGERRPVRHQAGCRVGTNQLQVRIATTRTYISVHFCALFDRQRAKIVGGCAQVGVVGLARDGLRNDDQAIERV